METDAVLTKEQRAELQACPQITVTREVPFRGRGRPLMSKENQTQEELWHNITLKPKKFAIADLTDDQVIEMLSQLEKRRA